MTRPWSLSVVLLCLLVGTAPVGAQSPSPGASPGPTASEVPSVSPEPTPSGEPGAGPDGMPWETTLDAPAAGEGPDPQPWRMTAWRGGFAMLEGEHNGWVRLSSDGASWGGRIDAGRPRAYTAAIAPYGEGLIVVGRRSGDLVAWTSPDGERWRAMDGPPIFAGDEARNVTAWVQQLVTVGDRTLVQGGVECPEAICPEWGPRLWGLTRGGRWERLPLRIDEGRITDVFAGRGRFLATVETGGDTAPDLLVASQDGRSWRQVGTLTADAANDRTQIGETAAGFVLLDPDPEIADGGVIRTSPDGRTWTTAWTQPALPDVEWQSIAVDGDAAMVLGYSCVVGPLAVVSSDGGATWALSAGWPSTEGGCFRDGALRGATAVTVGECGTAGRAWIGTVPGVAVHGLVGGSLTGPIDPRDVPFEYACKGLRFTASDVAAAPDLADVDAEGLVTVQRIAARNGWPELTWRRVATNGVHTLVYGTNGIGPRAMVVYGIGGVLVAASDTGLCARAPGFSALGRLSLDPTKPAPRPGSSVLHLRTIGCPDQHGMPARITMLPGHVLLRAQISGSHSEVGCSDVIQFDVRLPRPLGDRRIWNAANLPLRELTQPG